MGKLIAAGRLASAIVFAFCGMVFAELEPPDAVLARDSDYCVIAVGTGDGLAVRWLVFGNAGWQQFRADRPGPHPIGRRAILYLSQSYDSIGMRALREIENGRVATVNVADWPESFRANLKLSAEDSQTLPPELHEYIVAVQRIAAKARVERIDRALQVLRSMATQQLKDSVPEYQRIHRLANDVIKDLHADDITTLQMMTRIIMEHPESPFGSARGAFAGFIASKYFRPGFDAVRAEAFRNSRDTWSSEQNALEGLARIGNEQDLQRLRMEGEEIVALRQYREILGSVFGTMGQLTARVYPEGSRKRDEWRKWFERICAYPTPKEQETSCRGHAALALHSLGNAETKALLQSLMRPDEPGMNSAFRWAIEDIDARLRRPH